MDRTFSLFPTIGQCTTPQSISAIIGTVHFRYHPFMSVWNVLFLASVHQGIPHYSFIQIIVETQLHKYVSNQLIILGKCK